MLVLSRRENDKILFPNLGIAVEILRIRGNTVRVGIEAPADVRILRHEVADQSPPADSNGSPAEEARRLRHEMRNRLNIANLALHLVQRLLDVGRTADAELALQKALTELESLDKTVGQNGTTTEPSAPAQGRWRALVVEDNANERELLAGCLRMHGFEVDVVEDGQAAMAYLAEHNRPDVVLLDMRIPRLNGEKTISAIRDDPALKDLKVFAVSGSDQKEFPVPIGPAGVNGWFAKPVNPQALIDQLDRDLDPTSRPGR